MKRDWDTIRRILLAVEALPTMDCQIDSTNLHPIDPEEAAYHMRILIESGLLVGACREAIGPSYCFAHRLTWSGHEFLDAIREESVWQKIKLSARKQGISLSVELIREISMTIFRSLLSGVV